MKKFLILLLGLCFSINIGANELEDSIAEIVVTATRQKTNIRYLPLTVTAIARTSIAHRYTTSLLPLISEQVPGLFITSRGVYGYGLSTGATGGIKIRGIGGSPTTELMVLIDGHPQFTGLMGHTIADVYQSLMAEKVEIVRGPASVLYGSNAMGGVMNIITRKASADGAKSNLRLAAGSYGTLIGESSTMLRKGRLSNIVALSAGRSDNHRHDMDFNQFFAYDKMNFQLSRNWSVAGDVNINHFNSQNPGTVSAPILDNVMHITRGMASASIANEYASASGALSYYLNWGSHRIDDGYSPGGTPRSYLFHLSDNMMGVNWYETFSLFKGNHTTLGFDYQHAGGSAWNETRTDGEPTYLAHDKRSDEVAGYIDFRQSLLGYLTMDGALRYNHHSIAGSEWIPQLGISLATSSSSTIKATVGKGFRNPTLKDLYMFRSQNPDLKAERMMNYELSWAQRFSQLQYGLNAFFLNADNLIETDMVNGKPLNVNSGRLKNWGIEATVEYAINRSISLNGNYSFLHTDKPITAAPRHKLYAGADYAQQKWAVATGIQWIGRLLTTTSSQQSEDFVLWNLRVSYQATRWLKLFADGENLLARKYESYAGFPMPRATLLAGFDITL